MIVILLDFQFKDIFNWLGGLIAFALFFVVCYFIGQIGVQLKSGINILSFINKAERGAKAKGQFLNEKGITLRRKGQLKVFWPIIGLLIFYLSVFLFIPTLKFKLASLILLIPVILGFFGIFLVPEQLSED